MSATLGVTMGDPAGIGPEVLGQYINDVGRPDGCSLVLVGDDQFLLEKLTGSRAKQVTVYSGKTVPDRLHLEEKLVIWNPSDLELSGAIRGEPSESTGRASFDYIRSVYQLFERNMVDGIVTGPVSKKSISTFHPSFRGHTEWFADRQGSEHPVMGITCDSWLATTVTRHLPLREVPSALNESLLSETIRTLHRDLELFWDLCDPVIGVTGLNPHAGEGGKIGTEEQEVIEPVVRDLQDRGFRLIGPRSAESLLTEDGFEQCDAVVVMFHDQAFVPFKARGLNRCASVTFGLDMVRTSVAHGTGFGLVGTGEASDQSLRNAVHLAKRMVDHAS